MKEECRICKVSFTEDDLILPCNCRDGVCIKCLHQWEESRPDGKGSCEVCTAQYIDIEEDNNIELPIQPDTDQCCWLLRTLCMRF